MFRRAAPGAAGPGPPGGAAAGSAPLSLSHSQAPRGWEEDRRHAAFGCAFLDLGAARAAASHSQAWACRVGLPPPLSVAIKLVKLRVKLSLKKKDSFAKSLVYFQFAL